MRRDSHPPPPCSFLTVASALPGEAGTRAGFFGEADRWPAPRPGEPDAKSLAVPVTLAVAILVPAPAISQRLIHGAGPVSATDSVSAPEPPSNRRRHGRRAAACRRGALGDLPRDCRDARRQRLDYLHRSAPDPPPWAVPVPGRHARVVAMSVCPCARPASTRNRSPGWATNCGMPWNWLRLRTFAIRPDSFASTSASGWLVPRARPRKQRRRRKCGRRSCTRRARPAGRGDHERRCPGGCLRLLSGQGSPRAHAGASSSHVRPSALGKFHSRRRPFQLLCDARERARAVVAGQVPLHLLQRGAHDVAMVHVQAVPG